MSEALPLTVRQRRHARRLANVNGLLWSLGNGLTSTSLVIYLATELNAPRIGLGVGLIRAAPQLAGVLRLWAPACIGRLADRKTFCVTCYALSNVVLLALPLLAAPGVLPSPGWSLAALVGLWCTYHLLEYLALVGLLSWLGDLVPQRIRGRFFGRRDRWMVAGQAIGMLASGLFTYSWTQTLCPQKSAHWIGYAISGGVGTFWMLAAVLPLAWMPGLGTRAASTLRATLAEIAAPFRDRRFWGLLAFGCWFSFANGLSVPAQDLYARKVLDLSLLWMLLLPTGMRAGQWAIGPWLGRVVDRRGNKPVMTISLWIVACGPLFYFLATPRQPGWIVGCWIAWIAYAGLNVGLPNLLLRTAPRRQSVAYLAAFYAVTGLCMAASTAVNGAASDALGGRTFGMLFGIIALDYYHIAFLAGWFARSVGVAVLWMAVKEGDWGLGIGD